MRPSSLALAERAWTAGGPRLLLVGVDHRSAPLELREKVTYGAAAELEEVLLRLVASEEIAEAALVSTCNRSELVLRPTREPEAYRTAFDLVFLRRAPEIESEGRFYVKRDAEAARHVFRVASGLESMVLGEPEILGQLKRAAKTAEEVGSSGAVLQRLFGAAFAAAGRARAETAIGQGSVSFGSAVVDLARSIFPSLERSRVLVIGAGETARQVARSLVERGAGELWVANRSAERGQELLLEVPTAKLIAFDQRVEAAGEADVIVASTGADEPILTRGDLEPAMAARAPRPLLVVDLGVPRNVDPEAAALESLFLHDVDSLDDLIGRNLKRRRAEVPKAEEILERELDRFADWAAQLAAEPLLAQLHGQAEAIRRQALDAVRHRFPAETHDELEKLTRALVKRLLHHPSSVLRRSAAADLDRLAVVRQLFRLEDGDEAGEPR